MASTASAESSNIRRISDKYANSDDVYKLKDLFVEWEIDQIMGWDKINISSKWNAKICKTLPLNDHITMIKNSNQRIPFLTDAQAAKDVHNMIPNGCILQHGANTPSWNPFSKPKLGMIGGWGQPDTPTINADALVLVNGFKHVLESTIDKPYNLQMFHRQSQDPDNFPLYPAKLKWPVPEVFNTPDNHDNQNQTALMGELCDMATRISRRGALTWWHLDDSGEFVFQTGLPVSDDYIELSTNSPPPLVLKGFTGKPVVKIFIYVPRDSYDLVFQDTETNDTGAHCCLDIFNTPDELLPEELPTVYVAILEAGGPPLLSPPNIGHVVLTTHDCVMAEQRRVSRLYLDETTWFMQRSSTWSEPPIYYPIITDVMSDGRRCENEILDRLRKNLVDFQGKLASKTIPQSSLERVKYELLFERCRIALTALMSRDSAQWVNVLPAAKAACLKALAGARSFATGYTRLVYENEEEMKKGLAVELASGKVVEGGVVKSVLSKELFVNGCRDELAVELAGGGLFRVRLGVDGCYYTAYALQRSRPVWKGWSADRVEIEKGGYVEDLLKVDVGVFFPETPEISGPTKEEEEMLKSMEEQQ